MQFPKNPKVGGGGDFLSLKDGESISGVFMGQPCEFSAKWEGGRSIICADGDAGAKFRFKINLVVRDPESKTYVSKIWEGGPTVYNQLKDLNEDYPLEDTVVKITRNGSGKNTSYSILPNPKVKMTPEMKEALSHVELSDLSVQIENEDNMGQETDENWPPEEMPEDIPF